jgi:MFS family permease
MPADSRSAATRSTTSTAHIMVTRIGFKPVLMTGMASLTAGLIWFGQISVGGTYLDDMLGPSLLAGAGLGLAFVPITIAAVAGIQEREAGLASGLINTSQQIGGALGLAVLATIADSRTNHLIAAAHGNRAELPQALTEGFQSAFLVGSGFAALGFALAFVLIRGSDSRAYQRQEESAAERPAETRR